MFKQQHTSCAKVGSGGDLDLSREYSKKLFGPMFYSWCNCPLKKDSKVYILFKEGFQVNVETL